MELNGCLYFCLEGWFFFFLDWNHLISPLIDKGSYQNSNARKCIFLHWERSSSLGDPTAGAPEGGNAVVPPPATAEGLSPKRGKIILVGLKLLNAVLSDQSHPSPCWGKRNTWEGELWGNRCIACGSNSLDIMKNVFTYQIIFRPAINSWQLEASSVQEDKSIPRWLVPQQCNSCHHKQHWSQPPSQRQSLDKRPARKQPQAQMLLIERAGEENENSKLGIWAFIVPRMPVRG